MKILNDRFVIINRNEVTKTYKNSFLYTDYTDTLASTNTEADESY
jgi:hypothetical protein